MGPIEEVERRAQALSQLLLMEAVATLFAGIGAGFLTLAGWLVLDAWRGPVFASTVLGGVYLGLGLVLWAAAVSRKQRRRKPPPAPDPYEPFIHMAEGFAAGIEAGRAARGGGSTER